MSQTPKYSIITTCKGRWHHLVESLPAMLRQPGAEVVVVDYDCPDGTADHVARDFPAARVVRLKGVSGFNPSHARNSGADAAAGEVLIFVDADVIIADSFVATVDEALEAGTYAKPPQPKVHHENSFQGTCVVHKSDFDRVLGYDEVLRDYGGEDLELYERLIAAGVMPTILDASVFERVIVHDQAERSRFFEKSADIGFMVGKVYRVAKDMLVRLDREAELPLPLRQRLYDKVVQLVTNMQSMDEKELTLTVNIPDRDSHGLHRAWEFNRSVTLTVTPRQSPERPRRPTPIDVRSLVS
ncbi:glycosyltransferase family 2 protein [Bauldia sp.]|uniref:glycosyltransferase family 2 protein n=1 Tax=Bauldia sp. TaxID=2575872 RepID=UPI003BAD79E0